MGKLDLDLNDVLVGGAIIGGGFLLYKALSGLGGGVKETGQNIGDIFGGLTGTISSGVQQLQKVATGDYTYVPAENVSSSVWDTLSPSQKEEVNTFASEVNAKEIQMDIAGQELTGAAWPVVEFFGKPGATAIQVVSPTYYDWIYEKGKDFGQWWTSKFG